MVSELDLLLSLKSSKDVPFYLSGSLLIKSSEEVFLKTPHQTYPIPFFSKPFTTQSPLFKLSVKRNAAVLSLAAPFVFSNQSYKQKALSFPRTACFTTSLGLSKSKLLIDYKDLRFPRRIRSFSFPYIGDSTFFLPKRLHRLTRNRLVGLHGSTYFLRFLNFVFYTLTCSPTTSFLPSLLIFSFFTLTFFTKRLRFSALNILSSILTCFCSFSKLLKLPLDFSILCGRFVFLKRRDIAQNVYFFYVLSLENQAAGFPVLKFSKFLKQPRRYPAPFRFSPVLRSWG
jgi:hypothetical protein